LGAKKRTESVVEQNIAIMFADLKGFTSLSEKALPYDVVHLLNCYYREVGDAILHNLGWIDKYIGDGIMAIFGLQGGKPEDLCLAAARAALEGVARVSLLSEVTKRQFGVELKLRAGIHYGLAVVGEMGHPMYIQRSAIGDTVNIAQRLESTAKEVGASILASAELFEQSNGQMLAGKRGVRQLKGRGEPSEFVEVVGLAAPDPVFLVQTSFVHVRPHMADFVKSFYSRLFREAPELTSVFADSDPSRLKVMVAKMFGMMISEVQKTEPDGDLIALTRRHKLYGVQPQHFPMVGRAFLGAIRDILPADTDPRTMEAWEQVFENLSRVMVKGLA
jgi:class 3 adenylate cyclase/truncated hemoglobin YjbI